MGARRRRLTPQARRNLILDEAAAIILREGLAAASMERLGRDCGISKALVYNYFPSRDFLLAALLQREQSDLRERGMAEALRADTFADLILQTTRLYLEQTRDRGDLVQALLADPSVARLMEATSQAERDQTIRYFVRATRREFGLPLPVAIAAVNSLMGLTGGMSREVAAGLVEPEQGAEICVALIVGGLRALASGAQAAPRSDGR